MPPVQGKRRVQAKQKTAQYRRFRGVNLTDARTAIDDEDLAWLENAITIGNGAIKIVRGPATAVATVTGPASIWGGTINGNPFMLVVGSDGSITQVTPGGVTTAVAPAATVTTSAHITTWQGSRFLIIDPTRGYFTWDGTTFTTIDATQTGQAIAVFEGRVWIAKNRTISYTAPSTYNDFTAGNGAGSTLITDEAFDGNVVSLVSALEQLWVIGNSAIDAISNVQASGSAPSVTTTFSVTNIVSNLGSSADTSAIGYLRSLTFLAPYGVYALSGVTPQKLSDKLDGLFNDITFTSAPAAVGVIESLPVLAHLVTYRGSNARFNDSTVNPTGVFPIPMLLCFTQGKYFLGSQGLHLTWITTVVVSGVSQIWGIDSSTGGVYQLFGASSTTSVQYKVQSKQYDFGSATRQKPVMKIGLELQASGDVSPSMTVDSELGSVNATITTSNTLTLVNAVGATLQLVNALSAPLTLLGQGQVLSRNNIDMAGRYLGVTIQGNDPPYRIQAFQMEYVEGRDWVA